jgi:hypothetical protein
VRDKAMWWSGGIDPCILDLCTRWRRVASLTMASQVYSCAICLTFVNLPGQRDLHETWDWIHLAQDSPVASSGEGGTEASGYIKGRELLDVLSD